MGPPWDPRGTPLGPPGTPLGPPWDPPGTPLGPPYPPGTGKAVSTACVDAAADLRETIMQALLTAVCTVPVIMLFQKTFETFRKPTDRALKGEHRRIWKTYLPACCKKEQTEVQPVDLVGGPQPEEEPRDIEQRPHTVFKTPAQLAAEEPERLRRKSPGENRNSIGVLRL